MRIAIIDDEMHWRENAEYVVSEHYSNVEVIIDTYESGSLCTDNKNSLMWSHYADGHKGFCVEYDFNLYSDELENCAILPVIYGIERVKFPWIVAFSDEVEDIKNGTTINK